MSTILKILLLTNIYNGQNNFRKEIIETLIGKGHEVVLSAPICYDSAKNKPAAYRIIDTPFNRHSINPLKDIWLAIRYVKLLIEERPDVVLTFTIKPNVYGGLACSLCRIPQLANITGLGLAVERKGWLQKVAVMLYRIGLMKTHTVFFQNMSNMHFCEERGIGKRRKILLPGSGVNLNHFSLQKYPPESPLKFIFLGRVMREKGIEEYVSAARIIKKRHPNTEFHVVGACEPEYINRMSSEQNEVMVYHGRQSDVRPFIGMSHCMIHPSYYPEGMSNVLLESCATGRPIITTDRPGCREIVEDGVNGFVIKLKDVDDLVRKIEQFIALPYEQKREMGLAARRKVEREFDRQIVVREYLSTIEDIAHPSSMDALDELRNVNIEL